MRTQAEKAAAFRALHERPSAFIIPNPWEAGTARLLTTAGFEALATTSLGLANMFGRADSAVSRAEVIANCREIAEATDLPINADLENCFAHEPAAAAETIRLAAEAGAVGGSIEDWDRDEGRLYERQEAADRIAAAVEAARNLPFRFMLTARAENHIRGVTDLDDTIHRLWAFEEAGADVLYAPGLGSVAEIRTVCDAVSRPVNVLALPGLSLAEIVDAGAQRVSVGGALTWAAVQAAADAAIALRDTGDIGPLSARPPVRDWLAPAD